MSLLQIFAQNVKKYRYEAGLTQEKLAELSSLHPTFISAVECGRRNISIKNIEKIANALDISPSLLFCVSNAPGENEHKRRDGND